MDESNPPSDPYLCYSRDAQSHGTHGATVIKSVQSSSLKTVASLGTFPFAAVSHQCHIPKTVKNPPCNKQSESNLLVQAKNVC